MNLNKMAHMKQNEFKKLIGFEQFNSLISFIFFQ